MKILYTPGNEESQKVNSRRKSDKKRREWKESFYLICNRIMLLGILILVLAVIGDMSCFVWRSPYFSVEKVVLNTVGHINKGEMIRSTGLGKSVHLVRYPVYQLKNYIQKNPWVSRVNIDKEYPNRIKVFITERVPIALVVGKNTWGIDVQGYLLPGMQMESARQLPLITLGDQWEPGTTLRVDQPVLHNALSILTHIKKEKPEMLIMISEIDLSDKDNILIFTQPEGTEVRMGNENIPDRLQNFYKTIEMAREQQIVLEYIDLRYDDQGIVTKPRTARFIKPGRQPKMTPST